ncbi:uncharacterized protein LOC111877143 [Lactuca sativa]|uniref:uncharacterized protein LOC111877143 n=1 Tax=Lactuca sativa TaxID=4236 RepID=UPI000CD90B45|nr:uncharacterized protein LOC111877143 [Lactuca sativa]
MSFLSINVRGVGEDAKVGWVKRLKINHKATFVGLQETQISDSSNIDVNGGRSAGLISIWDSTCFQNLEVIKNRCFLIVIGKCKNIEGNVNTVNVYGPQSPSEKKKVWNELLRIINERTDMWVVFGDFNVVSALAFNRFIQSANLKDFNMGGEKFTYMSRVDAKLSKLDSFLVVKEAWNQFVGYGTPDVYWAAKFKLLKDSIKKWRRDASLTEKKEYNDTMTLVNELEKLAATRPLKNRRNLLHGLMINGRWSTEANEIKEEVFRFYLNKFSEDHVCRPKLSNSQFKSIPMMEAIRIESPFSLEEVKASIWDCGSEKV